MNEGVEGDTHLQMRSLFVYCLLFEFHNRELRY